MITFGKIHIYFLSFNTTQLKETIIKQHLTTIHKGEYLNIDDGNMFFVFTYLNVNHVTQVISFLSSFQIQAIAITYWNIFK